jgi:hypothetical protein
MYGRLARGVSILTFLKRRARAAWLRRQLPPRSEPMDRRQRPPHIIAAAARMERAVSAS